MNALSPSIRVEQIGNATLYLGDCREVLPHLTGIDALICDPPYGVTLGSGKDQRTGSGRMKKGAYASYNDTPENFRTVVAPAITQALEMAKRGAVFITFNMHALPAPNAIGGVHITNAVGRHCWGFNSLAPLALYGKAPALNKGARPTVIDGTESTDSNGHPCPKPLRWMEWAVGLASLEDETVLDPFMGSGTTGVACARLGRRFIGIEIEPSYFEIALRRIAEAQRQNDLLVIAPKEDPSFLRQGIMFEP